MKGISVMILGIIGAIVVAVLLIYVESFKIEPILGMIYSLFSSLTLNAISSIGFT